MKARIGWIETSTTMYGGQIYHQKARSLLADHADVELVMVGPTRFNGSKLLGTLELLTKLSRLKEHKDIWVRGYYATVTMPLDRTTGKNIVMLHHDDFSGFPWSRRLFFEPLRLLYHRSLRKADVIVTVSEFWKRHLESLGHHNVRVIYNSFDMSDFKIGEDELQDFRRRYGIGSGPLIYLGNCQTTKGAPGAYEALKDLRVPLVTSGKRHVDLPTTNLDLGYRDYLCLLRASSVVVTMSQFREGWCRTAHEAMLCGRPVIGSGRGGMRELLEGGGQIICPSFKELRAHVESLLNDHAKADEIRRRGRDFARQFTDERFARAWRSLVNEVASTP